MLDRRRVRDPRNNQTALVSVAMAPDTADGAGGAPGRLERQETADSLGDVDVNLEMLDITSEDMIFDEVGEHIQQNLEDEIVKEALAKGLDLRVHSREIEQELTTVERASVDDYVRTRRAFLVCPRAA